MPSTIIVGAKQTTLFGFDIGVNPLGVGTGNVDAYLPHDLGKPFFELLPGVAAIDRLPDTAAFTA